MEENWKDASSVYEFTCKDIQGNEISLRDYEGHVLLIVNVASKCGLTAKNYKELVRLDETYESKGLRIIAFPCNQFGKQEPGNNEAICKYTEKKNVKFAVMEKVKVNGPEAHPLWKFLKNRVPAQKKNSTTKEEAIKWNFTKFLINKEGKPCERFASRDSFEVIEETLNNYF